MRRFVTYLALGPLLLAACSSDPAEPAAPTLVTGDGSDLCLQEGDLPDGYLPPTGSDNLSNASSYVWSEEEGAPLGGDNPELVSSWLVLPEGGAGPEDNTADCAVYLFDDLAIDPLWEWYADGYAERAAPNPEILDAPSDAPGEDPRLFHQPGSEFAPRQSYTLVWHHANVIAAVGIDGMEVTPDELVELAQIVAERIEAAAAG